MTLITGIIIFVSYISLKNRLLRKFFAGEPTILIQNGKILEQNMAKLSYSYDYLNQPLTPNDLRLSNQYEGLAIELILDGKIIKKNLYQNALDEEWLYEELKKRGIKNTKEVAFAALATNGIFYVDLYPNE